MPFEYVTLVLCRDVYHCTPPALRGVPVIDVLRHLTCLDVEGQVRKKQRKL